MIGSLFISRITYILTDQIDRNVRPIKISKLYLVKKCIFIPTPCTTAQHERSIQKYPSITRTSTHYDFRMSANDSTVDLEDFFESATRPHFQSYITLDTGECVMKKTILVYGLPGPQASSVCTALVGQFRLLACEAGMDNLGVLI